MSGNRALYLASVLCLAGLVLVGCPSPGGGGGPTPPDSVVTAPEITVKLDTVEVLSGGTMDGGSPRSASPHPASRAPAPVRHRGPHR